MLSKIIEFLTIELTVLLTAALPIIELRGAIPVGIGLGMSPVHALIISFIGSMLPVPFILLLIRPIFKLMSRNAFLKKIIDKIIKNSMDKSTHKVQKYGAWALIPLVAIPLPGTGVWSGSLASVLLNIRFKWAFPAIFVGNLIAAIAVYYISNGFANLIGG